MSAETWRVVLDDGSVREVPRVESSRDTLGEGFIAGCEIGVTWGRSKRSAVAGFASAMHWPLAAILAPGEATRDEAIAAAVAAEREACIVVSDLFSKARIRERGGAR